MIKLLSPADGAVISKLTPMQKQFIDNADARINAEAKDFDYLNLKRESDDYTKPKGIRVRWYTDAPETLLEISSSVDFSDAVRYVCNAQSKIVYNLLPGTEYFWRVSSAAVGEVSDIRKFYIKDEIPDCLYIPSLVNVRDIGAFKTLSGKKIRPRIMIRGSEMDLHINISKKGKEVITQNLAVRTDLDLRQEALGVVDGSPLSEYGVKHCHIPCKSYAEFFDPQWNESNKEIFRIISDSSSYPIYMHCWGGADRTGTIIMLLGAILDIDSEDLVMEWEFSSLSIYGLRSRNAGRFRAFSEGLAIFGSSRNTWKQNALCYLRHIGVDDAMMDTIRNNFIINEGENDGK